MEETNKAVAIYDRNGDLIKVAHSIRDAISGEFLDGGIRAALKSGKIYKDHFFRFVGPVLSETIEVPYLCIIDGRKFMKQTEVAEYCGVTKQAVSSAKSHNATLINGKNIKWGKE